MLGILDGLRVIEGSAFVAAPFAGMTLAQLGAEVIRFDPIGGGLDYTRWPITEDGKSLFWHGLNKGKRSIQVDLRSPRGREILTGLITAPGQDAGLLLTNFPARGFLAYDKLRQQREDLIMVNIMGDRHGGSAVDYTINPGSGFACATGPADSPEPTNHVLPAWDCTTGQMAVVALLAAERHRQRTGEGQLVKLALADVAKAMLGNLGNISEVQINGVDRPKYGNYLYGALGRDYVTGDGRRVMIVALTPRQWTGLCEATGLGEAFDRLGQELDMDLSDEGHRFRARDQLSAILEGWFAEREFDQIEELFNSSGVCWSPYRTFKQVVETDPDCSTDNPMFSMVHQPGIGDYLMPASPMCFGAVERGSAVRAPQLGEHTDAVLTGILGLSDAEVGDLHDQGVVAGPS
jgi:2-methylfumaryl-CoA isomerase